MRFSVAILCLASALAACPGGSSKDLAGADTSDGGAGGIPPFLSCNVDGDCAPAAATCCDCPTFAVNVADPSHRACTGVTCPPGRASCPDNVYATCNAQSTCELACTPLVCVGSCAAGYAIDAATGCLSCECATPVQNGCTLDTDCVETRDDCCGCHFGGKDTAVLVADRSGYDSMLGCPPSPQCPVVNVCEAGAAPHCVAGACKLAATAGIQGQTCGRGDLPACPGGYDCTVNKDPKASQIGVGVCVPQI